MNDTTLVIGFGYKARHGKDTAVKEIVSAYSDRYDVRRYAFGDALKLDTYNLLTTPLHPYWDVNRNYLLYPHPRNQFVCDAEKLAWVEENKKELLFIFQHYGTDMCRANDPFCWVRRLASVIAVDKPQIALISDVRFKNEWYWVKAMGGFTVKVSRVGFVDPLRNPNHPSETGLDGVVFDYEIVNDSGDVSGVKQDAHTVFEAVLDRMQPQNDDIQGMLAV